MCACHGVCVCVCVCVCTPDISRFGERLHHSHHTSSSPSLYSLPNPNNGNASPHTGNSVHESPLPARLLHGRRRHWGTLSPLGQELDPSTAGSRTPTGTGTPTGSHAVAVSKSASANRSASGQQSLLPEENPSLSWQEHRARGTVVSDERIAYGLGRNVSRVIGSQPVLPSMKDVKASLWRNSS